MADERAREYRRFLSDHPGHPLGKGMPLGRSLRIDFFKESSQSWKGESHYEWWQRIVRGDPCAFCGKPMAGTVDHVEPKSLPIRGLGGAHSWLNLTGACASCNGSKGQKPLLWFMRERNRSRHRMAAPTKARSRADAAVRQAVRAAA